VGARPADPGGVTSGDRRERGSQTTGAGGGGAIGVDLDRGTWTPPAIFSLVQSIGGISQPDIEATLNMGVGMVVVCAADDVAAVQAQIPEQTWVIGELATADGQGRTVHLLA